MKLVNIGSDNGLLPDGTKPLPEPMFTTPEWGHSPEGNFTGNAQYIYIYISLIWIYKITNFKITGNSHLSVVNELKLESINDIGIPWVIFL